MGIVILFYSIMFCIIVVQIYCIINYVKKCEYTKLNNSYSDEVVEKTRIVIEAIKTRKIKKHILTDNTFKCNNTKIISHYSKFLCSELMKDISLIQEVDYNG